MGGGSARAYCADVLIPTMSGKEFAGTTRVKAESSRLTQQFALRRGGDAVNSPPGGNEYLRRPLPGCDPLFYALQPRR
jgi:hypothetical protein